MLHPRRFVRFVDKINNKSLVLGLEAGISNIANNLPSISPSTFTFYKLVVYYGDG